MSAYNIGFQSNNQQQKNIPPSYDTLYGNKIIESNEIKKDVLTSPLGGTLSTNSSFQNTISRSNSISCGFSGSSHSNSSLSAQNSKLINWKKTKNEQQTFTKENSKDLSQKLLINTADKDALNKSDLSPIRRQVETSQISHINALEDDSTLQRRLQRQLSDLTGKCLPLPSGNQSSHIILSKNNQSNPVSIGLTSDDASVLPQK